MPNRLLDGSVVAVVMLLVTGIVGGAFSHRTAAYAAEGAGVCADWDVTASEAVATLAQAQDVDLRLVGDAIQRIRRARRSCHLGFFRFACLDYHAIIGGSPGLRDFWLPSASECAFPDGEPAGRISQNLSWR
jgi:hypothetical protein